VPDNDLPAPDIQPTRRWHLSLIWLVPLIAALAGLILVIRTYLRAGPTIAITFQTAEGIEAGKTEVKYKNVVVGRVKNIALSKDHSQVVVTVDLTGNAADIAVDDTHFWVERPRVDISGISGIGTVLSGAYIGVDIGTTKDKRTDFIGLEKPPPITRDQKGRRFVLRADNAGSLVTGAPVYYRRVPVGRITAIDLDDDGRHVTVQIFLDEPFDRLIKPATRFWNASGLNLSINADGLKLNAQSITTVLAGGIAFATPMDGDGQTAAAEDAKYILFADEAAALAPPDDPPLQVSMRFHQTTRGLAPGAPVDFRGINFGVVRSILLGYDQVQNHFYSDVTVDLFPNRLGPAYQALRGDRRGADAAPAALLRRLVEQGLRAQMRPGNLITGQMYIALDFVPNAKPAKQEFDSKVAQIPTVPGGIEQIQKQIQDIVNKLDAVPFDEIGLHLRDTLGSADSLLKQLDRDIAPEARTMLQDAERAIRSLNDNLVSPDAPLQRNARTTLESVDRAAYSLRALADYLERHPESLIRGKSDDDEPAGNSGTKTSP
jgi:paraquat-inducible protein B